MIDFNTISDKELIRIIIEENSTEAKEVLYENNKHMIYGLANQYAATSDMSVDDLIQEGCIGLFKAVYKYKEEFGTKFSTYCHNWIKEGMLEALKRNSRKVYVPHSKTKNYRKTKRLFDDAAKLGYDIDKSKLYVMANLNISQEKFDKWYITYKEIELANNPMEYTKFESMKSSTSMEEDVIDNIYATEMSKSLEVAIKSLDDTEKYIIQALFFMQKQPKQIMSEINLDYARFKYRKDKALKKLEKAIGSIARY